MNIHAIESNISTKRAECHSGGTSIFTTRWNGPTGESRGLGDIPYKYVVSPAIPALAPHQGLSDHAFQGLFFTGSRIVEKVLCESSRVALQAEERYVGFKAHSGSRSPRSTPQATSHTPKKPVSCPCEAALLPVLRLCQQNSTVSLNSFLLGSTNPSSKTTEVA